MHGYRSARALGVPGFIAPLGAGATSAFGFLCATLSFDFVRSLYGRLDDLDWSQVNAALEEMEGEGRDLLRSSGVADEEVGVRRLCEMRYTDQGHEVTVELPDGSLGSDSADRLRGLFRKEYGRLYGREGPDVPLETITWRLEVSSPRPEIRLDGGESGTDDPGKRKRGSARSTCPRREVSRRSRSTTATVSGPARHSTAPPSSRSGSPLWSRSRRGP